MKKLILLGGLFIAGTSLAVPLVSADISVGVMKHSPSGYIQYPADIGIRADLESTLGLEDSIKPFARAKIELPIPLLPNLYLQYMPMEFEGKGRYSEPLRFGTVEFKPDVTLDTYVRADRYDIGLYYNLPLVGTATGGLLDPEIGVNLRLMKLEGRITGTENNLNVTVTESATATVPIPMVYLSLGVNLPVVSLIGELRGISYGGSRYYDFTAEVRAQPISIPGFAGVFIGAGYRYEELRIDDVEDIDATIKINSLFANVGLSF